MQYLCWRKVDCNTTYVNWQIYISISEWFLPHTAVFSLVLILGIQCSKNVNKKKYWRKGIIKIHLCSGNLVRRKKGNQERILEYCSPNLEILWSADTITQKSVGKKDFFVWQNYASTYIIIHHCYISPQDLGRLQPLGLYPKTVFHNLGNDAKVAKICGLHLPARKGNSPVS